MSDLLTASVRSSADEQVITKSGPRRRDFIRGWQRGVQRYSASREAILDARDLESGRLVATSPDAIKDGTGTVTLDPYSSRIPQRWMIPLQLEQQIGDLMPDVLREPATGSETSDGQAQKTESWLRAAIEQQLPWRDSVGKAVRESEWAAYLLPSSAAWERRPTWMDAQSESIKKAWWKDADGATTAQKDRVDRQKSYRSFKEAYERYLASCLPTTYRLISALDCVPHFTRGWGKRRLELSSLMVRTLYEPEALLADGYRWDGMDRMLLPTGFSPDNYMGQDGLAYLYEWFYYVENPDDLHDKIPMVSYSVAGLETWNPRLRSISDDDPAEATVNLRERYGLRRHLMSYYWGFQRAGEDDPARKSIPMMSIWEDTILGIETLVMATKKHAHETAFLGQQFIPNPDVPVEAYTHGTDGNRTMRGFDLPRSGEVVSVPGEFKPVAPAPMSPVVNYLIESERAQLAMTAPDQKQFGGGDSSSGHELSVSHALFQSANSHVKEGLRQQVEDLAEWNLELADCLMETFDLDGIPLTSNQPVTAEAATGPGRRSPRERLVLTRGLVGGNYEVTCFYPAVGNLAEVAQENALRKDGMSTFDRVAEKMGVNDPYTLRVEIERDKYLDSEQGAQLKAIWLARYRGDDEAAQKLIDQGALAPDGQTPMDAISPEAMAAAQGAVQGGGGPVAPGVTGPAPGEMAAGGIFAGAAETASTMQDAVASSGIPQVPQARMAGQ